MHRLKGLLFPACLVMLWWAGSKAQLFNAYIIPAPERVYETAMVMVKKGVLWRHLTVSLYRVFVGFALTFLVAFPLAVFVGMKKRVYQFLEPTLEFIRHIPPIALIPMLILWFGIGETAKLAVIFLATFFPVFLNTVSAIVNCDKKLLEVGTVFHFSEKEKLVRIILPQAVPQIIVGMQLGLGYSWRSLIGAELIAASAGIGYMIIEAEQLSRPDIIIVGILTIGVMGFILDYLFLWLTGKMFNKRWEQGNNGGRNNKKFNQNL